MIRSLLERVSRNIVLKRKLPAEFERGPLMVSPGASLRYWKLDLRGVDPVLLRVVRQHIGKGDIVWDIGANVGLFTFAAANLAGRSGQVLAVEADVWLISLLRRSAMLEANRHLKVDVLPAAISNRVGLASFNIATRGRAANFLATSNGSTQAGGIREVHLVPTVTLDWLLEEYGEAPSFLKIDVEGAEEAVLRGATNLLSDVKPTILCEVAATTRKHVTRILKEQGYTLYDAQDERLQRPLELAAYNTLAYPP